LKSKRKIVRPILAALHHQHRVSVAEVEMMNVPDRAVIAFALVSNDRRLVNSQIDKVVDRLETLADVVLLEHDFEITNY